MNLITTGLLLLVPSLMTLLPVRSEAFSLVVHHDYHPTTSSSSSSSSRTNKMLGRGRHHRRNNAAARVGPNNISMPAFTTLEPLFHSASRTSEDDDDCSSSDADEFTRRRREVFDIRGGDTTPSILDKTRAFASKNFFLLGMVAAVSLAKLFPELGKNGSILRPELYIGKYGVTIIFLLSGLSLKLSELANAAANMKLNFLIQAISFGAWPFLVGYPLTQGIGMLVPNLLPKPLLDGLLIMTCLPTTINMCILLTSASGGNVATALCNTVISNLAGIFLTPMLLLRFFGKSIELPFVELVSKLCNKVLLPMALGQALRATPMKDFYSKNSAFFKRLQEVVLLGLVWNTFCNAFTKGLGLDLSHAIALLILLPLLHLGSLAAIFSVFRSKVLNTTTPGEAVAATFCASQKTLGFGLLFINTIFEGNPNLASYCAPIMLMHPLQLVIGSFVVPYFTKFAEEKSE